MILTDSKYLPIFSEKLQKSKYYYNNTNDATTTQFYFLWSRFILSLELLPWLVKQFTWLVYVCIVHRDLEPGSVLYGKMDQEFSSPSSSCHFPFFQLLIYFFPSDSLQLRGSFTLPGIYIYIKSLFFLPNYTCLT